MKDVLAADDGNPLTLAPLHELGTGIRALVEETFRRRGGKTPNLPGRGAVAGAGCVDLRLAEDGDRDCTCWSPRLQLRIRLEAGGSCPHEGRGQPSVSFAAATVVSLHDAKCEPLRRGAVRVRPHDFDLIFVRRKPDERQRELRRTFGWRALDGFKVAHWPAHTIE